MSSREAAKDAASMRVSGAIAEPEVARMQRRYGQLPAKSLLQGVIQDEYRGRVAVVSSFGAESAVILALVAEIDPTVPVIFLDTGWHFAETLAYRDRLAERLGLTDLRSVTPAASDLDREDADRSLQARDPDRCCHIRKVLPLERALGGFQAWITGRKRFHGGDRSNLEAFEEVDSRIKLNPLARWTPEQITAEFRARALPVHPLVAQGYPSIGCAPCTAPISASQPVRSGRWIDSGKTECGIHGAKWARAELQAGHESPGA